MKNKYFFLTISFFFIGALFFLIQKKWIVFYKTEPFLEITNKQYKEVASVFLWKNNEWIEIQSSIVHQNTPTTFYTALINTWLTENYNFGIIQQKIMVKHLFFHSLETECFINFTHNFLDQESATEELYMLIESLLKTLRKQKIACQKVMFLAEDKPLENAFLDFSLPWPLEGFLD